MKSSIGTCILLFLSFAALQAEESREVRVGVLYPLTGPSASTGKVMMEGAGLAADLINQGHSLSLTFGSPRGRLSTSTGRGL